MTTLKLNSEANPNFSLSNFFFNSSFTRKKLLSLFKPVVLVLMLSGFINSTMAQTSACWGTDNCNSGDFTLNKIYLASDLAGTPLTTADCSSPGATVNVYLAIKITNGTSSDRDGVFLSGNISSGNTSTAFAHCFPGTLPAMTEVTFVDPTSFTWNCGTALMMTDAFTGWNSASGPVCTGDCSGATTSKCRTYPDLIIVTPLVANFTSDVSCEGTDQFQTISFTNTTTGGTPPYTYKWEYSTDDVTYTQFSTAENPTFEPGNTSSHFIRLTVKDASAPQNTDVETNSGIAAGTCCVTPTINNQPDPQTKCAGEDASFTVGSTGGNPAPTIQWQVSTDNGATWDDLPGETGSTLSLDNVTVGMDGNKYRAVLTSLNCPPANSNAALLTVNALPVIAISGDGKVCANSTGNVYTTEAGMTNYLWTVTGGTITSGGGTTDNTVTVTWGATSPGHVKVNYTDDNGCTAAAQKDKTVTIDALPVITISGDGKVCANSTGNVYTTEAGMTNYLWTVTGGTITSGGGTTDNTVTVTWGATSPGHVKVNYTDADGCTAAAQKDKTVTIDALPVITISGPASACANSTGNVYTTQAGMANYLWTVTGGTITSGGGTSNNTVTVTWGAAGTGHVKVNYTDANGCTAAAQKDKSVTIYALPTITGTLSVCVGSTTQLTGNGTPAASNPWVSSAPTKATVSTTGLVTGVAAGTANITYTNSNGCKKTVTVTVKPLPSVNFTARQNCVSNVPSFTLTATTNGTSLLWSKSAGADGSFSSTTTSPTTYTPGPLDKTNGVIIKLTAYLNGCSKYISKTLLTASCTQIFSYTQGYYHNDGTSCTPSNGTKTGLQLIQLTLDNMNGILGDGIGQLYLGRSGHSFTATYSQASKLQAILPGGGTAGSLAANYNLNSIASYPPLSNGKINNILLSQTITLALNIKIPNNPLKSFIIKDGYLTTISRSGSSCTAGPATCSNGGKISSLKITTNSTLMNLIRNQRVDSLLKLASKALGGTLPSGVSYSNISNAVDVINRSFDEGRFSMGYFSTQKSCGSGSLARPENDTEISDISLPEEIVVTDQLKVTAYPNPFTDKVKFSIESPVSGKAVLEVFNSLGQKLHTVYQGYLFAGSKQTIDYNVPSTFKGSLFYSLKIGNQQANGKLIQIK